MKKSIAIILAAAMLAACAPASRVVPSLRYCTDLEYTRHGKQAHFVADCELPND